MFSGCCTVKTLAPRIPSELPSGVAPAFKPTRIHKAIGAPAYCVDVHAHFFNASDVPVKGFLEGPLAHSVGGQLAELVRLLSPFAQMLASLAPDAASEYDRLTAPPSPGALVDAQLRDIGATQARDVSNKAYELLKGSKFESEFNRLQKMKGASGARSFSPPRAFGPDTLVNSMRLGETQSPDALREFTPEVKQREPYPEGITAFVGYMLSYRYMNMLAYQSAYSTDEDAFGIDNVCGALVDFDHWLECGPRSPHDDQVRLHQLLSVMSGGYMRPLVGYNPWSDVVSGGASCARVMDAISKRGFVGVKVYPPNGFRPYGNAGHVNVRGQPSGADIDKAMLRLWQTCAELRVPVMAHTSRSMGADDALEDMGGPTGWKALLTQLGETAPPRVSLGHFGGDSPDNQWTEELAALTEKPTGSAMYGDLAYWSSLECPSGDCPGRSRLAAALQAHPSAGKRIMYGSDWHMLSREPDWKAFPQALASSTHGILDADAFFGGNARHCFERL